MGGKNKRPKFAEGVDVSTGGESRRFRPSHIRADHNDNQRWSPYDTMDELKPFIGDKCCFKPATIERRLSSFLAIGQESAVKVSMSGTGHPDLEVGFLRHCAFLLAEVRGVIDDIPGAKGMKVSGIRAELVKASVGQGDQSKRAQRNYAENDERQELSPVDRGLYFKRRLAAIGDDGKKLSKEDLAEESVKSVDYINKHLRLFACLKPDELLEVHEGTLKMGPALARAKNRGSGNNSGPRGKNPGVKHSALKRAVDNVESRPSPKGPLDAKQLVLLAKRLSGASEGSKDRAVEEWIVWLDADRNVGGRKKSPTSTAARDLVDSE